MYGRVAVAALAVGVLSTGCVSISQVQTADTLGTGKFQFAIEPGMAGAAVFAQDDTSIDGSVYYPHVDLGLRYGVADRVDLGVRFGSSLVELQTKFLLTHPNDPDKAISLAPSAMALLGSIGEDELSYINLALPVLVGFKTSGGSEFVLGPRVSLARVGVDDTSVSIISAGASVGYALRVAEGFRLMPEVAVSYPLIGSVDTSSDSDVVGGFNGGFVQFKLGFLFGAGRPINRSAVDENENWGDNSNGNTDTGY
ncbi:hypothetical protein [Hyalangium versicolor]|uniref:hypothetical protein n=1 Tax=Hyalangium versicolor TaxID=2861190 RepID=UPI001CCDBD68|nr:hypothetical protein [Hyalangium versicolor]